MKEKEFDFNFKNKKFAFFFYFVTVIQYLVSLVLGEERCLCCSQISLRIPLCKKCLPHLNSPVFSEYCSICGRELISEIGVCSFCRESEILRSVDRAFSLHGYQLWKKSLLFAWKLESKRNLSPYFAAIFYKKLKSLEAELGFTLPIVPVPPRKGKIREKGWDQIDELCFYLEKGWNVKILHLLERLSKTQQKKLAREQRLGGISLSYRLKSQKKLYKITKLPPKAVVIADDVLTTGSTIEACARELKKFGIEQVFSITLFIVD